MAVTEVFSWSGRPLSAQLRTDSGGECDHVLLSPHAAWAGRWMVTPLKPLFQNQTCKSMYRIFPLKVVLKKSTEIKATAIAQWLGYAGVLGYPTILRRCHACYAALLWAPRNYVGSLGPLTILEIRQLVADVRAGSFKSLGCLMDPRNKDMSHARWTDRQTEWWLSGWRADRRMDGWIDGSIDR